MALLDADYKRDAAVLEVDAERVGAWRLQVAGGHVEDPHATGVAEGNIWDIIDAGFIYLGNRATHRVYRGYRAGAVPKHHHWIGDGVAVGVAHSELHRNSAAGAGEYTASVGVDRLQNDTSRVRATACAVADGELGPVVDDGIVTQHAHWRKRRSDVIRAWQVTGRASVSRRYAIGYEEAAATASGQRIWI